MSTLARTHRYHRLNVADKQRYALGNIGSRLETTRCPTCGIETLARDLPAHESERCDGRPVVPQR